MEPQMNKQVQHVFLFLCQKPLWAQISWKPTGPRRHKFGEMHSGSRPLTDPGECPRLGSRLQLFSEQNTASASQNKADKSYTDSETDNYQRFVFCREQKEIFEERERRARALKKKNRLTEESYEDQMWTKEGGKERIYCVQFQHPSNSAQDFTSWLDNWIVWNVFRLSSM